jgi:hypothetical protein
MEGNWDIEIPFYLIPGAGGEDGSGFEYTNPARVPRAGLLPIAM